MSDSRLILPVTLPVSRLLLGKDEASIAYYQQPYKTVKSYPLLLLTPSHTPQKKREITMQKEMNEEKYNLLAPVQENVVTEQQRSLNNKG
ncbi:hypothetical protein FKM82_029358 [Ascaphus truei]